MYFYATSFCLNMQKSSPANWHESVWSMCTDAVQVTDNTHFSITQPPNHNYAACTHINKDPCYHNGPWQKAVIARLAPWSLHWFGRRRQGQGQMLCDVLASECVMFSQIHCVKRDHSSIHARGLLLCAFRHQCHILRQWLCLCVWHQRWNRASNTELGLKSEASDVVFWLIFV